jgi:hypothetical protein
VGAKALSTFKTDLKFHLGRVNDTTIDDYTAGWINSAYIDLTTKDRIWGLRQNFYFPELMDTSTTSCTDGTAYVQSAARCLYVEGVHDSTNDVQLHNISWNDYEGRTGRADSDSEGDPTHYVVHGAVGNNNEYRKIWLYPTPDSSQGITIAYRKIPAELSAATDVTDIGVEWDEPLLQLAVIQTHIRLNEFPQAEYKKGEWMDTVSSLIGIYNKEALARKDIRRLNYGYQQNEY